MAQAMVLVGVLAILSACATMVTRSADRNLARADRNLAVEIHNDIFDDFLWLTPPSYGKKVLFNDGHARLDFAGRKLEFRQIDNDIVSMAEDGGNPIQEMVSSSKDHYFNLDLLHWKTELRWRQVSETHMVSEPVMVTVTEMHTAMRSVYDSFSKSYRMESVSEPRTVTRWENRMVMKTEWVWRRVPVQVLDIPSYDSWRFTTNSGFKVILYALPQAGGRVWYFQNLSYAQAAEEVRSIFGTAVTAKLVFLDANQDGIYDGPDDALLYNTWNPYDQSSRRQDVLEYSDNRWQKLRNLAEDAFLGFQIDPGTNNLAIINANTPFLGSRKNGDIIISKLPARAAVMINGRRYRAGRDGVFDSEIQYGHYKLTVSDPGYFDWVMRFTVDAEHPFFKGEYARQAAAASLQLVNHGYRAWRLSATDTQGIESGVNNQNNLALAAGEYRIELAGGGNVFSKTLTVKVGEVWIYDFTRDTLVLKPNETLFY